MHSYMITNRALLTGILPLMMICFWACSKNDIDDEPPVIIMTESHHFPHACDTVYVGETFVFKATFTDNRELGAYSIDIHHNFDHHSHSTDYDECDLDPPKTPTDAVFLFIQTYTIPDKQTTYDAEVPIEVPENAEIGDYHLFVALTDKEGWQTIKGFGIKVAER